MIFELIIAIIIAGYLRKSFQTKLMHPGWNKELLFIQYAAIVLIIANNFFHLWDPLSKWLSHLLLLYLVYLLYTKKELGKVKAVLYAIAPFIILSLFSDITKLTAQNHYTAWKNLLDTAVGFSIVWMIVMWLITTKQNKALEKEKTKTKEEEAQKKLMASMKEQLEVQVAERTSELTRQKEELQQTLEELKATQSQLIQSEKMASLGELTAGIAHEIQNPLNFVNNFSEVNKEMLEELKAERLKPKAERDDQAQDEIINDIIANEEKINHHGKRADAIVKGMLQHSRKRTGQKEPTDINALCDEYLRLSYHGLRAKDKSFNVTMKTGFDENIDKINIIPQDMGRVLLNLINNAFYAVDEKKKMNIAGYDPVVSVSTRPLTLPSGSKVAEIKITDNGNGIPQNIFDKIFQPFFTTKPTGLGTGLGLSLSYDIVKAHGGEIKVESPPAGQGESGTEFTITIPFN